jgi:hypothetical protein
MMLVRRQLVGRSRSSIVPAAEPRRFVKSNFEGSPKVVELDATWSLTAFACGRPGGAQQSPR